MPWVYVATTFAITLLTVPLLAWLAPRLDLIDHPDARKQHQGAVPLVGGLAMGVSTLVTTLIFDMPGTLPWSLHAISVSMMLLGMTDDRFTLGSVMRFGLQAAGITACLVASGVHLESLGHLVGPFTLSLGMWALPFTIFGVLGIVNAINLCDGVDGLAGGLCLTTLLNFLLATTLMMTDGTWGPLENDPRTHILILIGAVAGFLFFNARSPWRSKAKVFMGDAGSLFLGFNVGFLAILLASRTDDRAFPAVAALWALIVPLYDTVGSMTRRILQGYSPMRADRKHLHHLLLAKGMTASPTVTTLVLSNALGGLIGIGAWRAGVPDWLMFGAFLAGFALYLWLSIQAWARTKELERAREAAGATGTDGKQSTAAS